MPLSVGLFLCAAFLTSLEVEDPPWRRGAGGG